jgi:transcriptional regulator with XRE-family HTH domain
MTMIDTTPSKSAWVIDGEKVQRFRQERGISYEALVDGVGISADDIHAIESGVLLPDSQTINRIARQLGVATTDILDRSEPAEIAVDVPEDAAEVTDTGDDVQTSVEEFEIPTKPGGWKQVADVEQRLRLYAARASADILREFGGSGPFSSGGGKSVNPVDVITLAQWIVYGTHDQ